jgi:2-polyprenyl-3-methyl-5-hydroxy-6-metoxy-1,4-benzoquinol methylase
MSSAQTWDPETYARNARFVSDLGSPVVELLAPRPGERILDLGCGDGVLTRQLVDRQCEVVAIDSSAAQIEATRKLGLDAHVMNAEALPFREEFDAVFSNAVLHWITNADTMIAAVHCSLKPGDVIDWLETFAQNFLQGLSGVERADYLQEVRAVLEPQLRDSTGTWVADYVRLRFAATKIDATATA